MNNIDCKEGIVPTRSKYILFGGLLLSVIIKAYFIEIMGNNDMLSYHAWGDNVLKSGLADAYKGVYFPLQWTFFAFCSWIADTFNISWIIPLKSLNLLFDIAGFVVLVLLLKKYKLNPLYALLYCLHPWFLIIFAQGFVDSQFTFFILLSLLFLYEKENTFKSYFVAGVPLACAFLMKPQVMMIVAAIIIYTGWCFYKTRKLSPIAILIPLILLFLSYEAYFTMFRHGLYIKSYNITIPGIIYLPVSYLSIGMLMPCLTASMDNMWYPIAYIIKQPDAPIYSVNFPIVTILTVLFTLCGIIIFVIYMGKKYQYSLNSKCLFFIITFVVLIAPFFMTSAHCNHPFPATVLLIVLLAMLHGSKIFSFAFNALLLLMFLAIFARYGLGAESLQTIFPHNGVIANSISILGTVSFLIILYYLIRTALSKSN